MEVSTAVSVFMTLSLILVYNYVPEISMIRENKVYEDFAQEYADNRIKGDKETIVGQGSGEKTVIIKESGISDDFTEYSDAYEYTWIDFIRLKEDYEDIAAWITIPHSPINYPVMFSEGNYYIEHDLNKNKTYSGSIYIYNSQNTVPMDQNLVMYGHNLWNGTMFSYLVDIYNKGYVTDKGRNKVYIQTEEGLYVYEMFAAYMSDINDEFMRINFSDQSDFIDFCRNRQKRAANYAADNMKFAQNDKIITMVTCPDADDSEKRVVVNAKMVDFIGEE